MAKRWIRQLITFPVVLLIGLMAQSQVLLIPEIQTGGVVLKQQLWSIVINNMSGQTKKVVLALSVTDMRSSQPVMEASSGVFLVNSGVKRVMYHDLLPLQYSVSAVGFGMERQLTQPLPVGEYIVCYKLFDIERKNEQLVSECVRVIAEPLSPPQLILPDNESMVLEPRPVLTWTPPAPVYMFSSLNYDIIVSPLYENQSPQEALQRNLPVMTTSSIQNSVLYPPTFTDLQPGKTYAWQVVAKDALRYGGKSEVWTFTVVPDSVKNIINNASFIKPSYERSEITHLQQGVLKIDYYNNGGDSLITAVIEDMSDQKAKAIKVKLTLHPGQNLIQKDINRLGRLHSEHVYKLSIANSRKEVMHFRFIPKYYF